MSEPRLISPMLDGCIIGEAISCHNGVRCCPAIREATGEKYIVKIISIPAAQVQLDALLLTGALSDREAALSYFMEQAQDILKEKDLLASLSRLEGFTAYTDAQIVPMEDGVGFEVYLMTPYKRSVERIMSTDTLTHLGVVNMGLDLCAALAACRRAGYLYIALKPENIFFTQEHDYRIGDLGFVALSSLRYTTLPEKYHSAYVPSEMLDTMAVIHETADTYALGMVLYQAYNGGKLPVLDGSALEAPQYADYEMAQIILKACASNPEERWADPVQMGQALVSYLQRNTVNDEPIIPPVLEPEVEEPVEEPAEEPAEEEAPVPEDPEPEELAFMQELTSDETAPNEENTEDLQDAPVTEETSQMLAQADDLIAHKLPEPVVAPEAAEVPMPEPIEVPMPQISLEEPEPEEGEVCQEPAEETSEEEVAPQAEDEPQEAEIEQIPEESTSKRWPSVKMLVSILLILVALACAALGAWYYYDNIYLQDIDRIYVDGSDNMLTVRVDSDIPDEKLTVYCTDSYGNTAYSAVTAGIAVFQELNPSTRYNIRVEIDGFHKLIGNTTSSFTTDAVVNIENFQAVIGATDGSALLSFRADGNPTGEWLLTYGTEGESSKTISFTGHSVSVSDLTIGSEYTFTLSSSDGVHLNGTTQAKLKAGKLMFAQDLTVTACGGGVLSLSWNAPEGEYVDSWTIRCYNEAGFTQTVTTYDPFYTFTDLDQTTAYTVEVFAENMSQSTYITVSANPVTVTSFHFDDTVSGLLKLSWEFTGAAPAGGWVLTYTTDGMTQEPVYTTESSAELYVIPGSHYAVRLQTAEGTSVFGGSATYDLPEAEVFDSYGLSAENIESSLCIRPDGQYWSQADVAAEDYVNTFAVGQRAGMILHALTTFDYSQENVRITYLVRSSDGTLLNVGTANSIWDNIFPAAYGALNIPFMPEQAGEYSITIYFNGKFVTVQNFSIV